MVWPGLVPSRPPSTIPPIWSLEFASVRTHEARRQLDYQTTYCSTLADLLLGPGPRLAGPNTSQSTCGSPNCWPVLPPVAPVGRHHGLSEPSTKIGREAGHLGRSERSPSDGTIQYGTARHGTVQTDADAVLTWDGRQKATTGLRPPSLLVCL